MSIKEDYDTWAFTYDADQNLTHDMEGHALRKVLGLRRFMKVFEAGCGTGKNTAWLSQRSDNVVAADFSSRMLAVARTKVTSDNVVFRELDLLDSWPFPEKQFDLIVFSLVLEHVKDLNPIFSEASKVLIPGGIVYVGELHPYKQYTGAKARFENEANARVLTCYTHHISSFYEAAQAAGLTLTGMAEHFDDEIGKPPRLLTLLFEKPFPRALEP